MSNINLNIEITDSSWDNNSGDIKNLSEQILETAISYIKQKEDIDFLNIDKPINVGLRLSNDEEIKGFNKEFRNKDSSTNVLSFASIDDENFYDDINFFDEIELGDIIISYNTLKREAEEKNIPFINHYTHLLIHGILHLLGFDHIENDEAEEMESFEIQILKTLNIDNPYME